MNAPWYRRAPIELRNIAVTIVLSFVALAVAIGAVILVTGIATR
jgi:hypothetical protein